MLGDGRRGDRDADGADRAERRGDRLGTGRAERRGAGGDVAEGVGKPERSEVEACSPNLWAILRALPRVRIVVTLGATPLQAVSGQSDAKITRLRGQWFDRCLPGDEARVLRVMPTFHPAYLLRSPWEKPKAWADLLEVVAEMRGAM